MKILIWIQVDDDARFGGHGQYLKPALDKLVSLYGTIEIVGMIDSGKFFSASHGIKLLDEKNLADCEFDLIVVSGNPKTLLNVRHSAEKFDISPEKIILDRTICTQGFSQDNYRRLWHSHLSVLSKNCWGGVVFSFLGFQYNSPTVNMLTDTEEQFLAFLKDPFKNLTSEPEFVRMDNKYQKDGIPYPVFKTGVTEWHMNHYIFEGRSKEYALKKWLERLKRINWFNLLVVISTERPEIAAAFDSLPYSKKICFTNFRVPFDSSFYMPLNHVDFDNIAFLAGITPRFYNIWDMLLYGKKTPLFK